MLLLTAVICLVLARVGEAAISDFDGDLIAYWKLDEIDGSSDTPEEVSSETTSVANDANPPTVISPGKVGDAFDFDGSSGADRVKTDGNVSVGTSFSVSVWLRLDRNPPTAYRRIVENDYSSSFYLGCDNTGKYLFIVNNDFSLVGPSLVVDSINWVHVAGTYDSASTTAKLYVNNNAVTNTSIAAPSAVNLPVTIGSSSTGNDTWTGDIDEVRIYNRALTAGEIDDLYNNVTGGTPPSVDLSDPPYAVASNAAPGTLVGTLSDPSGSADEFQLATTATGPDSANFQITGTTNLRTAVWMNAASNDISIVALSNSTVLVTNDFAITVDPSAWIAFKVGAEVGPGVAAGGETVGFLSAQPGSGTGFDIVGGRGDLFAITGAGGTNLTQVAGSDPGANGTVNWVEVRATNSALTSYLLIGVEVVTDPAGALFMFK